MKIVLVGYMGSGKSLVGKRLSEVLNMPFIDLDTAISNKEEMSISEIFNTKGELYFRRKEAEMLENMLENNSSFVLATGGGTPCYGNTMHRINEAPNVKSIFLSTSVEVLTERLYPNKVQRPLISHLKDKSALNDFIRKHLFERNFVYLKSKIKVNANLPPAQVVEEIVLKLI